MRRSQIVLLLVLAFALRLAYGLSSELFGPDESQVFLIGLQYFTTGAWPYYGPDVVYTHTQLPGALQGLLVGGPMFLVSLPESAYVVLNLLSFGGVSLLAWYIGRRLPHIPRWFLWPWLLFAPWTLNYSTYILNNSYVLVASSVFFVSVYELIPQLRIGVVSPRLCFLGIGAAILWVAQLHMAFVLMVPIAAVAIVLAARERSRVVLEGLPWLIAGAVITGVTLVPTLLRDGHAAITGLTRSNMHSDSRALLELPSLVARFFSFASFEIARFLGANSEQRFGFLKAFPVSAPFVVIAGLIGALQTCWMIVCLFRRNSEPRWTAVRRMTLGLLVLVAAAFTASVKGPASHAFYVLLPAVMIYSFYCWAPIFGHPLGRRLALILLVCGGVTQVTLGVRNFHLRSLYTNRPLIMRAITEKNYHLVGERRPDIWRAEGR